MDRYSLAHLADRSLLDALHSLVAKDRATTADLIAHIAEVDRRQLYRRAGFRSMFAYCVESLRLSEDAARKRVHAARAARRFPAIFAALEDGRLHLAGVVLIAPRLTEETFEELFEAACHRTRAEIEEMLAERFPGLDVPDDMSSERAPGRVFDISRMKPIAAERSLMQCMVGRSLREKFQYALELMSHRNPTGAYSVLLESALDAYIPELEKERFGETDHPQSNPRATTSERHIPAQVKRAVWKRDGGACTYVGDAGHACGSRWMVEFDHVQAVACGGEATIDNVRLLCRAHNQMSAEDRFGGGFMEQKRREAMEAREQERQRRAEEARAREAERRRLAEEARVREEAAVRAKERIDEVIPWLRKLRFTAEESRLRATKGCEFRPDGSLEDRVKVALSGRWLSAGTTSCAAT